MMSIGLYFQLIFEGLGNGKTQRYQKCQQMGFTHALTSRLIPMELLGGFGLLSQQGPSALSARQLASAPSI